MAWDRKVDWIVPYTTRRVLAVVVLWVCVCVWVCSAERRRCRGSPGSLVGVFVCLGEGKTDACLLNYTYAYIL